MAWTCFLIVATDRCKRELRRFTWSAEQPCPLHEGSGHDAMVPIEDGPVLLSPEGYQLSEEAPRADPRWPTACACGYVFQERDQWQLFSQRIYVREDTGQEYTLKFRGPNAAPVGAMWDAPWNVERGEKWTGPDGRCLMVRLPPDGHDWCIDGPSSGDGPGWTRTGVPPMITVTPSILTPKYHGFLRDGVLTDDLDGRTYD